MTIFVQNKASADISITACTAIRDLGYKNPRNLETLSVSGVCEAVLDCIEFHESMYIVKGTTNRVTQWCWYVIAVLSDLEECRVRLGSHGCCEALIRTIMQESHNREICHWCCLSAGTLAKNSDNSVKLGAAGICECIVKVCVFMMYGIQAWI